mmetsp:Transcript_38927/g.62147  ORF Transcript_38927/g.62147 Transcript_38927/m.62147 type:complete len:347 (+) Transcript_38927:51-1091(+)|eukprot:CAMPEP_0197054834 /NCGR_PEP_ID=MMETSP1384-20130603/51497_1 /TAXON_ID=29189 /ORGANISM="Ammonia sp." /LENGTH=346 /DNA_ID=CAMNT_0042488169 /DNA_START=26 /DNA_END=1066 /DNA_ORIENTATION=+
MPVPLLTAVKAMVTGGGVGCCNFNSSNKSVIDTEIKSPDWADACVHNKLHGIKMLHAEDPDLINEPVDEHGHKALHLAIQNKNFELLQYLLQNGANINAKGGAHHNTALHEAVLVRDMKAIRTLFSFGIDDSITNRHGTRAIDLCPKSLRREFTKAKSFKNKHRDYLERVEHSKRATLGDVTIAGMQLKSTPAAQIRKYIKDTDHALNFYRNKKKEIEERDMPQTTFGDEVGCDVDEIAMTLHFYPHPGKLWDKWAKKHALTRQTEIYKILYGLTLLALKEKNPRSKKPRSQPIKSLTSKLCKALPKKKGKTTLSKEDFVKNMANILFQLHEEMLHDEMHSNTLRF